MNDLTLRLKKLLTWNELDALKLVHIAIDGRKECFVSVKDVTNRVGMSRSFAANMFRILEAAGVVETRSLGMKGTYIKVLDPDTLKEVVER